MTLRSRTTTSRPQRPKLPPVHPGEILLEEFLGPRRISQYRFAKDIQVPPRRREVAPVWWRVNPWSIKVFSPPPLWFLSFSPPASHTRVVGS
jgi:hypothetical protein